MLGLEWFVIVPAAAIAAGLVISSLCDKGFSHYIKNGW